MISCGLLGTGPIASSDSLTRRFHGEVDDYFRHERIYRMRKAYIHAGAPKTGSTAIQMFCRDHEPMLAEQGFFFPKAGRNKHGAHHIIANALRHKNFRRREVVIRRFKAELEKTQSEKLLITTEALHTIFANRLQPMARKFSDMRRFSGLLQKFGFEPEYILVLRDAPAAINSSYTQAAKSFNFHGTIDDWVKERVERFVPVLDLWTQFIERNGFKLHPIAYDESVRREGIIPKFLNVLDVPVPPSDEIRENRGTDHVTVAAARTLIARHHFSPTEYGGPRRRQMRGSLLSAAAAQGGAFDNYWGLSPKHVDLITRAYAEDQEAFAQRYWKESWNDLYSENYDRSVTPCSRDELGEAEKIAHDEIVERAWREMEPLVHVRLTEAQKEHGIAPTKL